MRIIAATKERIDDAVYELYGVSKRDVAMVEHTFVEKTPVKKPKLKATAAQIALALRKL
jgi:hypothetical protein